MSKEVFDVLLGFSYSLWTRLPWANPRGELPGREHQPVRADRWGGGCDEAGGGCAHLQTEGPPSHHVVGVGTLRAGRLLPGKGSLVFRDCHKLKFSFSHYKIFGDEVAKEFSTSNKYQEQDNLSLMSFGDQINLIEVQKMMNHFTKEGDHKRGKATKIAQDLT